jgi:hypothetical protein
MMPGPRVHGIALLLAAGLAAAASEYLATQKKFDQIEAGKMKTGTRVMLTERELTDWAAHEVPTGVRDPKVQLGPGTATGSALVDFGKIRRAQGSSPGWLMAKLLDGERPIRVSVRIRSANRMATVDVERVEVSGYRIEGQMLDFLIQNFLLALYPDAAVGKPFEIGSRVDRIEVAPGAAAVVIGK